MQKSCSIQLNTTAQHQHYQARVKVGRMTVVVEIGPELIDVFVRGKYLVPKEAFTRQEIGEALTRAVALMRG